MPQLQQIVNNLRPAYRKENLEGRDYLVVPMVMMTEGVHSGSNGPVLYPQEELSKAVPLWNHKPVVIYHPMIDGKGTSACSPSILNKQKVGLVLNTVYDGKQRAEAWIEESRLSVVDKGADVLHNILNSKITEVSTGLFIDPDFSSGDFNGEPYDVIARNHAPDHLAILPDQVGACSVAKGAGLLQLNQAMTAEEAKTRLARLLHLNGLTVREIDNLIKNELSHNNVWSLISTFLRKKFDRGEDYWNGYLEDVFDEYFIYSYDGKLYKQEYTKTAAEVTPSSEGPVEVVRVTKYEKVDGSFVGNSTTNPVSKELNVTKKELIDGLISNSLTKFEEKDRAQLDLLSEETLQKLVPAEPVANKGGTDTSKLGTGVATPEQLQDAANKGGAQVLANNGAPTAPLSDEQWLAQAPAGIRSVVQNAMAVEAREKEGLITTITANSNNKFTKEWLQTQEVSFLRGLAELAKTPVKNEEPQMYTPAMYAGAAAFNPPVTNANGGAQVEDLDLPVMNFETAKS